MTLDSSKAAVAITGAVSVGLTTATAPTGTSSVLTGFTDLGLINEDGVTETRDRTTDKLRAWQNGMVVRVVTSEGSVQYKFVMLETKKETVELYYGTTVTQTSTEGTYVIVPESTGGRRSFVLDVVDGAELERVYIASGEIVEVGDKVYQNNQLIGYEVTVEAYNSPAIGGNAKVWATRLKSVA